jgi:Fe-S-cluster containining protein
MKSFDKFEPYIHAICQTIHSLIAMKGLNIDTIVTLYRHFLTQLVPFDERSIQCSPGCGYCCHLKVSASVAEVLVIVDFLKNNQMVDLGMEPISSIHATSTPRSGQDDGWWVENAVPCIFLDTEKFICNIYEVRPFSCRAYHSLDLEQCRNGYSNRAVTPIPCYSDFKRSREIFSIGFERAMAQMKLQSQQVEVSSTALRFLQQPDLMNKWLAGEQIFPDVR